MSDPYVGEIRLFAGRFAPVGWAFCNGQQVSISDNDVLYSLIGSTYGGDGQTTFNLPDLQGRLPIGQGTGTLLSPRTVGEMGGAETVTLQPSELAVHSHTVSAQVAVGTQASPLNGVWGSSEKNQYTKLSPNPALSMDPQAISAVGGSQPHDNVMPFLVVSFIIALQGIYPSH